MDNGVDPVLRDQRSHTRLVTDVADHERRALRYCPIETCREVVEHHDALAGVDERMNHMASDIAGAAGDQDRHARARCYRLALLVWVSGMSGWEACMHVLATVDKPAAAVPERGGI